MRRAGSCQSAVGRQLVDLCECSRVAIIKADKNELAATVSNATRDIRSRLVTIEAAVQEEDKAEFKRDAYAYVFQALALYLQVLRIAVYEERGEPQELKDTPPVLLSFIEAVLYFKKRLRSWKAKVPGRYKNDRPIRDVDDNLITPLRRFVDQVQAEYSRLERQARKREAHQAHVQMQRVRVQETGRREEVERSELAWRRRWHHLHVRRMQCERDITKRRQHLWFVDAPDLIERDSEGIPIERVSGLGHRTHPPPRWLTSDEWEGEDWTEPQDVALLETLQMFPGMWRGLSRFAQC